MKTSTFALVFGLAFLALGVLGLAPATLMPPPAETPPATFTFLYGYLLGLFPTNILLSLLRIFTGIWALMAAGRAADERAFARGAALLYGVLAIMGLVPLSNTVFGWMPIYGNDVWLHALAAVAAAYFGWRAVAERRRGPDRRWQTLAVAHERRHDSGDRRFAH